jgi:predicted enzyme related to lactoylglutathione lyase
LHNQVSINLKESFMQNAISWFEIPTLNLSKAQQFYEAVLQCTLRPENMGPSEGAVFPYDEAAGGVGGALMCGPSAPVTAAGVGSGVLVYLDCAPHTVDSLLQRVVAAGGRIAMPRTALPPGLGFIACMFDLDGNKIGLHSLS